MSGATLESALGELKIPSFLHLRCCLRASHVWPTSSRAAKNSVSLLGVGSGGACFP